MAESNCFSDTILLPIFEELSHKAWFQALTYLLLMFNVFIGITIIADIFMCSIERITSSTKKIYKKLPVTNEVEVVEVEIWNKTVANLTLMALGSSAPEILLATIEIIGNNFNADDLGPGAIVGAAAFNLFVVTAVCILVIPKNKSKRIYATKVFAVTAFYNIFAYIWLYLILRVFTEDYVTLTEAILTLLFFPLLVLSGFAADRNFFRSRNWTQFGEEIFSNGEINEKSLSKFIREVRKIDSSLTIEECEQLAKFYIFNNRHHSPLFYRISAIRFLSASNSPIPQLNERLQKIYCDVEENLSKPIEIESNDSINENLESNKRKNEIIKNPFVNSVSDKAIVSFSSKEVMVSKSESQIEIIINRSGKLDIPVICEIETIDRTANANREYEAIKEMLTFELHEIEKKIVIKLLNDGEWNPNKMFLVKLHLPHNTNNENVIKGDITIMKVTIIDEKNPGVIEFVQRMIVVPNTETMVDIPLVRCQGSDGEIRVKWRTIDGNITNAIHFYGGEGEVIFNNGVIEKEIQIPVISHLNFEKEEYFEIALVEANGGAMIGKINRLMITLTDDKNYDNTMKKIMAKLNQRNTFELYSEEWIDQIKTAFAIGSNDSDGCDNISTLDYVLHFLSFGWKVLFAFIPPVKLCGGWLTFFASIIAIGILTTLMGDFASAFGCVVGLEDHVTAITIVALGTSMPDLFASKTAAIREKYADNAIGNIFGSNAFNVFLGLGLPWLVATTYHSVKGTQFTVNSGSLESSVGLFVILAIICTLILVIRRNVSLFGFSELGGPKIYAWLTAIVFIIFWFLYISLAIWWSFKQS